MKKERYILCPAREPSNTFLSVHTYQATAPQLPNHNPYRSFQTCTQTSGFCSADYLHSSIRLAPYERSTYQVRSLEIAWPPNSLLSSMNTDFSLLQAGQSKAMLTMRQSPFMSIRCTPTTPNCNTPTMTSPSSVRRRAKSTQDMPVVKVYP